MEPRREKLSDLLHSSALPPPPIKRPLIFGGIAAVIGATACAMAAHIHELRLSYLALAIGTLVGVSIIRRGGYGKYLAVSAALLTLITIPATYFATFTLETLSWCTEQNHADLAIDAAAWGQLENATDTEVFEFAEAQSFPFTTREAFDYYPGKMLSWFAENSPSLQEWRAYEYANSSFSDYLTWSTTELDYLLAVVSLLLAAGIVQMRTTRLEDRAKQKAIAQRMATSGAND